jgi:FixJ family two-component response regulator
MRTERSGGEELVLYIIDADASVREGLCRLAASAGFGAKPFASIEQFVTQSSRNGKGCVLLDSSLLHVGKQFKATMRSRGIEWPVIVLCASVDEAARHEARAFGAHFFLNKPVDAQALFDTITWVTEE